MPVQTDKKSQCLFYFLFYFESLICLYFSLLYILFPSSRIFCAPSICHQCLASISLNCVPLSSRILYLVYLFFSRVIVLSVVLSCLFFVSLLSLFFARWEHPIYCLKEIPHHSATLSHLQFWCCLLIVHLRTVTDYNETRCGACIVVGTCLRGFVEVHQKTDAQRLLDDLIWTFASEHFRTYFVTIWRFVRYCILAPLAYRQRNVGEDGGNISNCVVIFKITEVNWLTRSSQCFQNENIPWVCLQVSLGQHLHTFHVLCVLCWPFTCFFFYFTFQNMILIKLTFYFYFKLFFCFKTVTINKN